MKVCSRWRVVHLGLVLLFFQEVSAHGSIHEQIRAVTALIAERPKEAALYVKRGELHRVHEDWSLALADYATAVELDPGIKDRVELLRGVLFFRSGRDEEARTALDNFLLYSPDHVEALITRARALAQLGEIQLSIEDYDRALSQVERPRPGYYVERARTVMSLGPEHTRQALMGLEQGIATLGPVVTVVLVAIELETADGRFDSALARLDQIIAQASRTERWLFRRGEILELAGRWDDAVEAYESALRRVEAQPPARRWSSRTSELESQLRAKLVDRIPTP